MPIYQAVVLGIVQGLTEILPVSSSGHLILVPAFLGWPAHSLSFDAALHLGTAFALLAFFAKDWIAFFRERRWGTIGAIVLASIPVGLIGLIGSDVIERSFRGPALMAGALIGVAVLMLAGERWYRKSKSKSKREDLEKSDIFAIALAQALALVPGVSRSGITILGGGGGGGLRRDPPARFSFLISLPIVFAAGLWELFSVYREGVLVNDWAVFAVGIGVSFFVFLFSLRLFF